MINIVKGYLKSQIFSVDYGKMFERFVPPARSNERAWVYIIEAKVMLLIWKPYKSLISWLVDWGAEYCEILGMELFQNTLSIEVKDIFLTLPIFAMCVFRYNLWKREKALKIKITLPIFEYDTYYEKTFLKEKFKKDRLLFHAFFWILPAVELFFSIKDDLQGGHFESIDDVAFAGISILISGVFAGCTKSEYEEKLRREMEEPAANIKVDYSKSIKKLEKDYGENLILKNEIYPQSLPGIVRKMQFNNREEEFLYRNTDNLDHLELMKRLLNKESVLTDTPFYKDMGVALFMPLHRALLKGKKIIFFSGGSESNEKLGKWVKAGLKTVTRMEECWQIVQLNEKKSEWDVGLITPEDMTMLYEMQNLLENTAGYVIVLLHPERLLIEAQNELYEWGYMLSRHKVPPVYVVIERAIMGLLDVLSHVFQTEFKYISKAAEAASINKIYAVNGQRRDVYEQELKLTSYIGIDGLLAKKAKKAGVTEIDWMAGNTIAFYDVNSIKKQHPKTEGEEFCVECHAGLWGLEKKENAFLILTDEINNIFELTRLIKTRGEYVNIISVVSSKYLLLPFMLDSLMDSKRDMLDIYGIPAMSVNFSETNMNRSIILVKMLLSRRMSAQEIRTYRSRYTVSQESYTGEMLNIKELEEIERELKCCLQKNVAIRLRGKNAYSIQSYKELEERCDELTAPAVYVEEEEKKKCFIGGKHRWQIDQFYLPGQIAVLNGKMYQIKNRERIYINQKWEEVLIVRRYRSGIVYSQTYYQDRLYKWSDKIGTVSYQEEKFGLKWAMIYKKFSVKTKGYYTSTQSGDKIIRVYTALPMNFYRECEDKFEKRNNMLMIKFKNDSQWETRRTMAIIFSEVFKTLFPYGYPYLAVLAPVNRAQSGNGKLEDALTHLYYKMEEEYIPDSYDLIILEDSKLELGLLSMINRHMEHILRLVYTYYKWWEKSNKKDFGCIVEYKYWSSAMNGIKTFIDDLEIGELPENRDGD